MRLLARAKDVPPRVGATLGGVTAIIALIGAIIGLVAACSSPAVAGDGEDPGEFLGVGEATASAPIWIQDEGKVELTVELIKELDFGDVDWKVGDLPVEEAPTGPVDSDPPKFDGDFIEEEGSNQQEGNYSLLPVYEQMTAWIDSVAFRAIPAHRVSQPVTPVTKGKVSSVSWEWQIEPDPDTEVNGVKSLTINIDAGGRIFRIKFEIGILPAVGLPIIVATAEPTRTETPTPNPADTPAALTPAPTETPEPPSATPTVAAVMTPTPIAEPTPTATAEPLGPSASLGPVGDSLIVASALLGTTAILWPGMWRSLLQRRRRKNE